MRVLVATSNAHKLDELRALLGETGLELIGLDDLPSPLPAPVESGETFEANAELKARHYASAARLPALADDSGLVVDALNGEPGVHSARWMGEHTPYEVKNTALLARLEGVEGAGRSARFVCVAALAWPDGRVLLARGEHEGRIHHEICGLGGFGYDPVFFSLEAGDTFARLSAAQKNALSHRSRAVEGLRALLPAATAP